MNRVGIRMYVSVGPGGAQASNFTIGTLTAERSASGDPLIVAKVYNGGRRTLSIRGDLTLSMGPGGLRAGPFPVTGDPPSRRATRSWRQRGSTPDSPSAPGEPTSSSGAGNSNESPRRRSPSPPQSATETGTADCFSPSSACLAC